MGGRRKLVLPLPSIREIHPGHTVRHVSSPGNVQRGTSLLPRVQPAPSMVDFESSRKRVCDSRVA